MAYWKPGPVITKDKIVAIKRLASIFCCFCAAAQIKLFTQFVHKDKERKTRSDWEKTKEEARRELSTERLWENKDGKQILNETHTQLYIATKPLCILTSGVNIQVKVQICFKWKYYMHSSSKHSITCSDLKAACTWHPMCRCKSLLS